MENKKYYYFDTASSSQIDKRVIETMHKVLNMNIGNPHSDSHEMGWMANDIIEDSRKKVAELINAQKDEIIFTSGATESNNIAIQGIAKFYKEKGNHIITITTEHKCVLESCKFLETEGFEVTYLSPNIDGSVDLSLLEKSIKANTILISIMAINNETGVIQDIEKIGQIAKNKSLIFHTDAAQAYGKIPIDVEKMNIDLLSISGHKIYGPQGIGALYVNKKSKPRIRLKPLVYGGGQERGMRSGTNPTFLISGLGRAAEIAKQEMHANYEKYLNFRKYFLDKLMKIEDIYLNGTAENTFPGIVNLSILHIEGESFMMKMPEICISTGSACNSTTLNPSYVITSMRSDPFFAHCAIRISFSTLHTQKDIEYLTEKFIQTIDELRKMSPLWQMKQQGIDLNTIDWSEDH